MLRSTLIDGRIKMNRTIERTTESLLRKKFMRRLPALSVVILAGLLAGCGTMNPTEDDTALSGDQLTLLITGNTFRGGWEGRQLTMVYFQNGVVRGSHGLTGSDSGTWTVEGDVYCHRWVRLFDSTRRCYKWWRRESDFLLQNVDAFRIPNMNGTVENGMPDGF